MRKSYRVSETVKQKVLAVLQDGPLARRTIAYRAGVSETPVRVMVKLGILEIVGHEPGPRGWRVPQHYRHPVYGLAKKGRAA